VSKIPEDAKLQDALKTEEGAMSQGLEETLKSWKKKAIKSIFPKCPEETQPCLILAQRDF